MLTNRLGADQRTVTRTLRVVMAVLLVLAISAVWNVSRPGGRAIYWAELVSLLLAMGLIEFVLLLQRRIHALLDAQKQVNAQLRASEAKFSGILAIAADAIIVIDDAQNIMHFNQGAEEIFGYQRAEIVGRPLELLLPDRFREAHAVSVQEFAAGAESSRRMGHRRPVSAKRKDGSEFPAEAAISRLQVGDSERVYTVVLRDITEQKFTEDAQRFLVQATAEMSASLDVMTVAQRIVEASVRMLADACVLQVAGDDGSRLIVHAADERSRSMLLTLVEEFSEQEALLVPATAQADAPATEHAIAHGPVDAPVDVSAHAHANAAGVAVIERIDDEWRLRNIANPAVRQLWQELGVVARACLPMTAGDRALGTLVLLDLGTSADRFAPGTRFVVDEFVRSATLAIDNAHLYATARRATRVRDEVLGLVSHDLRNPIGAIAMCARILREAPPADAAQRDRMVSAISESAVWMQRLIRDLLDVTSIEAGHLAIERQPSVISTIVSGSTGLVMAELANRSLDLQTEVEPDLPLINVDGGRIIQVLSNLLGNAIKFTEPPGTITLRVQRAADGVMFSVADTGVGITQAAQDQIFDRFWQERPAQQGGYGLGLAIAQGIVREHGGRLWVESTVGQGSVFSFTIPVECTGSASHHE